MKVVAAYLLAVLGGNPSPDSAAVCKILASVSIEADKARVDQLVSELKGKDLSAVIAAGTAKLASLPTGGGGSTATTTASDKGKEEKDKPKEAGKGKKEKVEEPKEEEEEEMGFGLFD